MRKRYSLPVHLLAVIFLALLTGCGGAPGVVPTLPGATDLPTLAASGTAGLSFQAVAGGYLLRSTQSDPGVQLISEPQGLDALAGLITRDHLALLKDVDFAENMLLAVFWGVRPSGGASISVETLALAGDELTVAVRLNENDPNLPRVDASTYPYHLVTIARDGLPAGAALHYRLVSADALLAEGRLP